MYYFRDPLPFGSSLLWIVSDHKLKPIVLYFFKFVSFMKWDVSKENKANENCNHKAIVFLYFLSLISGIIV